MVSPKNCNFQKYRYFFGNSQMGALVKCPILYHYCVAKACSCVRLFKFLKSDVWLKSYREICEKQFFLAGAFFFVAHSNLYPHKNFQVGF
jgi:hypothetical protein